MRRTDDEFIKEVYERRQKHLKKIKQRNLVLSLMLPILIFGIFVGPAMLPASSADKSAPPLTSAPAATISTTYPPGTVVIKVQPEGESREYSLEGDKVVGFIEENVYSQNSSQSSSAIHDEAEDSKRTDMGEKICSFSFYKTNQGLEKYSYSLYENALCDELSGEVFILMHEQVSHLKGLLQLN